ncbi:MAG: peptidylprolyl isomerase [Oscillospiraceae bacterium]|nr:peptidylprolyl isomerase [Oscillospiraceae bacterium]
MSSSKKKQLRKEQYMTERQIAEKKEAKKLRNYTLTFCIIIALVVSIFVGTVLSNPIKNVMYKNTKAITVGDYTLTSVDVNYYYLDTVNSYINQYGSAISLIMDVSKPLNEQVINNETGATWADNFMESVKQTIKSTYALYDMAVKANHQMSDAERQRVESNIATMQLYAAYYGYNNLDGYLRAMYGNGASEKSYRNYLEVASMANSYLTAHSETLDYSAEELLNYQQEAPYNYNSYTFVACYLKAETFCKGGTTDDKGNTTYTDAEKAAGLIAAELAAKQLAAGEYADVLAFNEAVKALEVNKDKTQVTTTPYDDVLFSEISTLFADWIVGKVESDDENAEPTFEERKEGDMTVIPYTTGSGDTETTAGYYVVRYESCNDNDFALKNVRHLLVKFTGGTTNSTTGVTTYSDQEKKTAKDKADSILADWIAAGDLSENSFAELAKKHSEDNAAAGGLYEDVYPGQMVTAFNDWCYDEARKAGDYGIIETEYGYHIMFFVGDSETTFRNFMIKNVMLNEEMDAWHNGLIEKIELTVVTLKHIPLDMVLNH